MSKAFASTGDIVEKKTSFTEIGPDLCAFAAEGDPNTGVTVFNCLGAIRHLNSNWYVMRMPAHAIASAGVGLQTCD
jgi:hypothetical protein